MKRFSLFSLLMMSMFASSLFAQVDSSFQAEKGREANPWTHLRFQNDPNDFQFAIVSDRTGGMRPGAFADAVQKINVLTPEFVMSVGDLIEGYTQDSLQVNREWTEFNQIANQLESPFFYLPGNHDYTNSMMANQWKERYARDHYAFTYKDVLFLCLNTNDGDGVEIGDEQLEFIKETLKKHQNVRWTFVFMHHPIWGYSEFNRFGEVEAALTGREYTVFAGHNHRYMQEVRNRTNYYVLATTGGGSKLRGSKFGEFDHITWVTMSDDGPRILNLRLDGMLKHDISNPEVAKLADALTKSTQIESMFLAPEGNIFEKGTGYLGFNNDGPGELMVKLRFYHHHQVTVSEPEFEFSIPAYGQNQISFDIETIKRVQKLTDIAPLEIAWTLSYKTAKDGIPFETSGTYEFKLDANALEILTETPSIFTKQLPISLETEFDDVEIRYTLDGSNPNRLSPLYTGPVHIRDSKMMKARVFDKNGNQSAMFQQFFKEVEPLPAVKARGLREGLRYSYYEGDFDMLPEFASLSPDSIGICPNFNLDHIPHRDDHYAVVFEGYVELRETGVYRFGLNSDDGSKLYIDDLMVVNNDGSHAAQTKYGDIVLEEGMHKVKVAYFEDYAGEVLEVFYVRPVWDIPAKVGLGTLMYKK